MDKFGFLSMFRHTEKPQLRNIEFIESSLGQSHMRPGVVRIQRQLLNKQKGNSGVELIVFIRVVGVSEEESPPSFISHHIAVDLHHRLPRPLNEVDSISRLPFIRLEAYTPFIFMSMHEKAGFILFRPRRGSFGGSGSMMGGSYTYSLAQTLLHSLTTSVVMNPFSLLKPASSAKPRTSLTIAL